MNIGYDGYGISSLSPKQTSKNLNKIVFSDKSAKSNAKKRYFNNKVAKQSRKNNRSKK